MQVSSVGTVPMSGLWSAGSAPVLEIIPDADPLNLASIGANYVSN
jgi:hypothetical protein